MYRALDAFQLVGVTIPPACLKLTGDAFTPLYVASGSVVMLMAAVAVAVAHTQRVKVSPEPAASVNPLPSNRRQSTEAGMLDGYNKHAIRSAPVTSRRSSVTLPPLDARREDVATLTSAVAVSRQKVTAAATVGRLALTVLMLMYGTICPLLLRAVTCEGTPMTVMQYVSLGGTGAALTASGVSSSTVDSWQRVVACLDTPNQEGCSDAWLLMNAAVSVPISAVDGATICGEGEQPAAAWVATVLLVLFVVGLPLMTALGASWWLFVQVPGAARAWTGDKDKLAPSDNTCCSRSRRAARVVDVALLGEADSDGASNLGLTAGMLKVARRGAVPPLPTVWHSVVYEAYRPSAAWMTLVRLMQLAVTQAVLTCWHDPTTVGEAVAQTAVLLVSAGVVLAAEMAGRPYVPAARHRQLLDQYLTGLFGLQAVLRGLAWSVWLSQAESSVTGAAFLVCSLLAAVACAVLFAAIAIMFLAALGLFAACRPWSQGDVCQLTSWSAMRPPATASTQLVRGVPSPMPAPLSVPLPAFSTPQYQPMLTKSNPLHRATRNLGESKRAQWVPSAVASVPSRPGV